MIKYHRIAVALFRDATKALFHPTLPLPLHLVLMILLLPFNLALLGLFIAYEVVFLVITFLRVPADFIMETIHENETMSTAALFVVYLVAYPAKFLFDFITGMQMVGLNWLFFFMNVFGWVGSLGRIRFQPLLMQAEAPAASSPAGEAS